MADKLRSEHSSTLISYLRERRDQVDGHLRSFVQAQSMPEVLRVAVERAVESKGKRLRGVLTLAVAEACGMRPEKVLDTAAAFELIHTSSLIIDDLPALDDAELRRGEPTLHKVFGEDRAILTAVALLNHAYELVARNHHALAPRRYGAGEFLQRVVAAVGWDGTIGGETVDLHSEGKSLDFQTLEYIHSRKTGALFVAAAASGAILANASPSILRSVEAYAKNLGLAFQITDDILDVISTAEELGKDVGKDEEKLTFVKLAGVDGARQLSHELIETSVQAIGQIGSKSARLQELALWVRDREV